MDEITIGDKIYVSSKRAAKITGYAKDYVGQLCREGRVEARLVGRSWYVLESSIREHRFGKEEVGEEAELKAVPEIAPEAVEEPKTVVASTWQAPTYAAEVPQAVPELAPKPAASAEHPAIVDMQSAWKEWFEEKKQAELPSESVEAPVEDVVEVEVSTYEVPVLPQVEEQDSYVPVTRVPEAPEAEEEPAPVAVEEEIEIHRSYATFATGEQIPATEVPVVDLSPRRQKGKPGRGTKRERNTRHGAGNGALQATFVVIAVAAVLVAIVGTGHAERLLSGTSLDYGVQKSVIDYLEGTSSFENRIKY